MKPVGMFQSAVDHMNKSSVDIPQADKLELYSLFKQATVGDVSSPPPSRFNVVQYAKWDSWNSVKGLPKDEAASKYIRKVTSLDPAFSPARASSVSQTPRPVATPAVVVSKPKRPPPSTNSEYNLVVIATCALLCGVGVASFVYAVLPQTALTALVVAVIGMVGFVNSILMEVRRNGVLRFLSPKTKEMLTETTFLEWCKDDSVVKAIKAKIQEIMPLFMSKEEDELAEALSNMSLGSRKYFTEKGLVTLLPNGLQRYILSDRLYQYRLDNQEYNPPVAKGPQPNVVRQQQQAEEPSLELQNKLRARLTTQAIVAQYRGILKAIVNPAVCQASAVTFSTAFLLQLAFSKSAKRTILNLLRRLFLIVPGVGAALSFLLLVLYKADKAQQKRNKKST